MKCWKHFPVRRFVHFAWLRLLWNDSRYWTKACHGIGIAIQKHRRDSQEHRQKEVCCARRLELWTGSAIVHGTRSHRTGKNWCKLNASFDTDISLTNHTFSTWPIDFDLSIFNSSSGKIRTKKDWWNICAAIGSSMRSAFVRVARRSWRRAQHRRKADWTAFSKCCHRRQIPTTNANRTLVKRNHQARKPKPAPKHHDVDQNEQDSDFILKLFCCKDQIKRNTDFCTFGLLKPFSLFFITWFCFCKTWNWL